MHFRESIKSGRKEAEKEAKRKRNVKDDKDAKAAVADEYVGELLINKKEKEELENPTYLKTENYQSQEENKLGLSSAKLRSWVEIELRLNWIELV